MNILLSKLGFIVSDRIFCEIFASWEKVWCDGQPSVLWLMARARLRSFDCKFLTFPASRNKAHCLLSSHDEVFHFSFIEFNQNNFGFLGILLDIKLFSSPLTNPHEKTSRFSSSAEFPPLVDSPGEPESVTQSPHTLTLTLSRLSLVNSHPSWPLIGWQEITQAISHSKCQEG